MHAEERQRECSQRHSEVRAGRLSGRFRLRAYRTVQTTSLESKRTPRDFPRRLFLYPVPSAATRTAPNGVKERASFCLVFRSLNTTSSRRMFSMGYRRAKSTQGNTNVQKEFFWQTTSGSLPAGLNKNCVFLCRSNRVCYHKLGSDHPIPNGQACVKNLSSPLTILSMSVLRVPTEE